MTTLRLRLSPLWNLIRLGRPTGTLLLFIPCTWGLILGAQGRPSLKGLCLFFMGAFLMRSAGCAYNDWVDQDYDKQVSRTHLRPLAVGSLTSPQAWAAIGALLFLAGLVFLALPPLSQSFALLALPLVALYPWMKRITRFPQVILGMAYNMGVFVGYAYESSSIPLPFALAFLYGAALLWTVYFDTLYAHQDRREDQALGLHSTTHLMPSSPKGFLALVLVSMQLSLYLFFYSTHSSFPLMALSTVATIILGGALIPLDLEDSQACLKAFKRSTLWGATHSLLFLYFF
jgi:4-hydroxybenzoate polyprenyl transferase